MRKVLFLLFSVVMSGYLLFQPFILNGVAWAQEDVIKHPECPYCGMDRQKFAHSRMLINYDDNVELGYCSLRCAAVDMSIHLDRQPVRIQVGDYNTKSLIDAENAFWVIGGKKMGVMSKRAKWAFAKKSDAQAFIAANGGELADFETAVKASYADLYDDNRMIREKRKTMRMKMQEKSKS